MGLAFGAVKVVQFGLDAVGSFSALEESVNAVTVVYGDQADAIARLGEGSAEAFGITTTEVNEAAIAMGAFVEKINESDPADAFKNVIQRATDFASVMDIDTKQALDDFQSGLAGQSRPLKKSGLALSAATVKQTALELGLIGIGEEMMEGQKVQARWRTIMKQTDKTAGDFANTADDLANSQRTLNAKWKEAQTELGRELAPVMLKLGEIATDLVPLFGRVVDVVGDLVEGVLPLIDVIARAVEIVGEYDAAVAEATSTETLGEDVGILEFAFRGLGSVLTGVPIARNMDDVAVAADAADRKFGGLAQRAKDVKAATDKFGNELPDVTDAIADFRDRGKEAEGSMRKFAKSVKELREEHRKLVDPVFAAERAVDDFDEAVREATADGIISQEEFERVTEAMLDMESAEALVGNENISALGDAGERVAGFLEVGVETIPDYVAGFDSIRPEKLERAETAVRAIDKLTREGAIQFDFNVNISGPTQAELEDRMRRVIRKLTREGAL